MLIHKTYKYVNNTILYNSQMLNLLLSLEYNSTLIKNFLFKRVNDSM